MHAAPATAGALKWGVGVGSLVLNALAHYAADAFGIDLSEGTLDALNGLAAAGGVLLFGAAAREPANVRISR